MAGPWGVLSTGFKRKTVEEILSDIVTREKGEISASLNTATETPIGQLNGIFAAAVGQVWELAEAVNSSFDPANAHYQALTQLSLLTGTQRQPATRSKVTATVNLNGGVTLPAGSVASVSGTPSARFRTLVDVVAPAGPAANYSVAMEAEQTGPVAANAGTLTVIATPVSGWNSVTNASSATLGRVEETDLELRLRRSAELRAQGTSPLDALRADLLELDGIDQAVVFENVSDLVVDGMPPHSIEAVVFDDPSIANALIAGLLWANKAAGIQAYGETVTTVTDSAGYDHTVGFTRATQRLVYLDFDVTIDPDLYPADGDDQVAAAAEDYATANYRIGGDVILRRLEAAI
ncbi:MAG: baseplate J/gp47 family protein, partial [Polyangiaceae bacterium]|nr:baseplate J/gp47 family protein [Polyangiaceae bacterium]